MLVGPTWGGSPPRAGLAEGKQVHRLGTGFDKDSTAPNMWDRIVMVKADEGRLKVEKDKFASGTWFCSVTEVNADKRKVKLQILPESYDGSSQGQEAGKERELPLTGEPDKDLAYCCLFDSEFPNFGYDNMTEIKNLNEAELARNLRIWHSRDKCYVRHRSGPAADRVPVRLRGHAGGGQSIQGHPRPVRRRRASRSAGGGRAVGQVMERVARGDSKPHAYRTAKKLFDSCLLDGAGGGNQAMVITGESGAGKTWNTKKILDYLAYAGKAQSKDGKLPVTKRMLDSNVILDAFGNSTMPRNDDSSRFGKLFQVYISRDTQTVTGCKISPFLLEKSRVCMQAAGERNFHFFYMLLSGASSSMKRDLHLMDAPKYRYLNRFVPESDLGQSSPPTRASPDQVNDPLMFEVPSLYDAPGGEATRFADVNKALSDAFSATHPPAEVEAMLMQIYKTSSAVLLMGQLHMVPKGGDEDASCVGNQETLAKIAELLQIDAALFEQELTTKRVGKFRAQYNPAKAEVNVRSIAATIYDFMFNWIVEEVSLGLKEDMDESADRFVGVLDIFGFECTMEDKINPPVLLNSFEQFCINLCNETLQNKYQRDIMDAEKFIIKEQLHYEIDLPFNDNGPALEVLFKRKRDCVKDVLGDFTEKFSRNADTSKDSEDFDIDFLNALQRKMKDMKVKQKKLDGTIKEEKATIYLEQLPNRHRYIKKWRDADRKGNHTSRRVFSMQHYAGEVIYDSLNWLNKNNGTITEDLLTVITASPTEFPGAYMTRESQKALPATILGLFVLKLNSLMTILEASNCHFVRCIKSNIYKKKDILQGWLVLNQLRYTGMMDALKIRKIGFPFRLPVQEFMDKYGVINRAASTPEAFVAYVKTLDIYKEAQAVEETGGDLIALGTPKANARTVPMIMMKDELTHKMDSFRREYLRVSGDVIQTVWLAAASRRQYQLTRKLATQIGPVIDGVLARQRFMKEYAAFYEPKDRQMLVGLIHATIQRQQYYEKKNKYFELQNNLAKLKEYLQNTVIMQHDAHAHVVTADADSLRAKTDAEIASKKQALEDAKRGLTTEKDKMNDQYMALQAELESKRSQLEACKQERSSVKSEAERQMEQLKLNFESQRDTWQAKVNEARTTLSEMEKEAPAIRAASDARLVEAKQAYELTKSVYSTEEDKIKQQQVDVLKDIEEAERVQLDTKNKGERQLIVCQEKFERLQHEYQEIDQQHAIEVEELRKSLRAQNWKLAQLHMSEQQSIEEFENLGLFVQAGHFHGEAHGSSEQGKQVDVLDAQIAVLKEQMSSSSESRLTLRSKLDHLMQTKYEVEAAWELATREQDQTVGRLSEALEKERRVSDKLEQACTKPGPPRHSRFDAPEPEPVRQVYGGTHEYVASKPSGYTPYGRDSTRPDPEPSSNATDAGLASVNALYKGHGTVHVSQLEKMDTTTLGAALRLLH